MTLVNRLRTLKKEVCASGASSRCAEYILQHLNPRGKRVVHPQDLARTPAAQFPQDASRAA